MVNVAITSLTGRGRLRSFLLMEVSPDSVRFLLILGLLLLKGLVPLLRESSSERVDRQAFVSPESPANSQGCA